MSEVDNNYINKAIEDLFNTVGIKDHVNENEIWSLIFNEEIEEGIQKIAKQLGLPIKISISYISDKYSSSDANNFESKSVVKTNKQNRGDQGITAQVYIPTDLPMYGSPRMDNFLINIKLSKNCLNNPDVFMSVIAHELSHIVLHSILHKEKDNEIYTDITAMMLGFSKIMEKGRKDVKITKSTKSDFFSSQKITETKTETTSYGYLTDENFDFAFKKINEILNNYKIKFSELFDKIDVVQDSLCNDKENIAIFKKYLENASKNMKRKIPKEDALRISSFFQSGYLDDLENEVNELKLIIDKTIKSVSNYNNNILKEYKDKVYSIITKNDLLNEKREIIKENINILKKYFLLKYKVKLFLGNLTNLINIK